uniref:Thiamine biosynthesis protein S n=1 Tax=Climaconeis cf. scalaris TaxID=2846828 RepID=A0A8F8SPS4_9STRA|nr:thiamine biosynthesis protein S [Climaconeis cf. scalaris]QYB19181.1 thiamine biosynthesis protein S [Climaconeis cf. scalaris]
MNNFNHFFLNGKEYSTNYNLTILELLEYFNYDNGLIVLEYNNLIYRKNKWKNIFINNEDKIEILTIVGGG